MDTEGLFFEGADIANITEESFSQETVFDTSNHSFDFTDSTSSGTEFSGSIDQTQAVDFPIWYPDLCSILSHAERIDDKVSLLSDSLLSSGASPKTDDSTSLQENENEVFSENAGAGMEGLDSNPEEAAADSPDIYAEKLDALIELQVSINDNLVRLYSNLYYEGLLLLAVLGFMAGGIFIYALLSRIRG